MTAGELFALAGVVAVAIPLLRVWYGPRSARVRSRMDPATLPPARADALEDAPPTLPLPKAGQWVMVLGLRGMVIDDGEIDPGDSTGLGPYWRPAVVVLIEDLGRLSFTPAQWRAMSGAEPPAVVG